MPTISYGDAVSNEVVAIKNVLTEMGFNSNIYAQNIHPKMLKYVLSIDKYKRGSDKNILIYHFSTGSDINDYVCNLKKVRKVMIYHNITPEHFFYGYNEISYSLCKQGRVQLAESRDMYELALADSEHNRQELENLGYKNTHVLPIICNFKDYEKPASKKIIEKYSDGKVNLLFLGRIAPNKKQEDVIKTFYYYKKYINQDSRLFLVGSYNGMERYYHELKELVEHLQLDDVYFTGHTSFSEILAYYQIADTFICMSEHEGFCVPLLECMYFKVPIIAYNSCAVPETLGNSGILVNNKNYKIIAEMIDILIKNESFRLSVIKKQDERLADFAREKVIDLFKNYITKMIG